MGNIGQATKELREQLKNLESIFTMGYGQNEIYIYLKNKSEIGLIPKTYKNYKIKPIINKSAKPCSEKLHGCVS